MEKTTLVLGASPNSERYSNRAVRTLHRKKIPFVAIGKKESMVDDIKILKGKPDDLGLIHTVTLYLNSENQKEYYDYILALKPSRVIFNPGAANPEFEELLRKEKIEVLTDCMLALLACGQF